METEVEGADTGLMKALFAKRKSKKKKSSRLSLEERLGPKVDPRTARAAREAREREAGEARRSRPSGRSGRRGPLWHERDQGGDGRGRHAWDRRERERAVAQAAVKRAEAEADRAKLGIGAVELLTEARVRSAFRQAARTTHPDKKGGTEQAFIAVQDAQDRLLVDVKGGLA